MTDVDMGKEERDPNFCLPGRPPDNKSVVGEMQGEYGNSLFQAYRARMLDQNDNQFTGHVSQSPFYQGPRSPPKDHEIIKHHNTYRSSDLEPALLEAPADVMEWLVVFARDSRDGSLYRFQRHSLGDNYRHTYLFRLMDTYPGIDAYQFQKAIDSIICTPAPECCWSEKTPYRTIRQYGTPLRLPSMKSNPTNNPEGASETSNNYAGNFAMEDNDLVPRPAETIGQSTKFTTSDNDNTRTKIRKIADVK
ncbi:hypothetical protein AYI68_g3019 [Smittium mucronatum]|uniref:Uncharacterized protein n=1 Tax=Smittium mucronatum TaxID=133383 RepID=A0A1R0H137_9FUNG|nr:hypothetical protein AYI68_g3019 [Smittium mucronatum]